MASIISISDLPIADSLLSSDKFYIFTKRGNSYIKNEITINDLTAFFYDKTTIEKLDKKYKELLKLSSDFVVFLKSTYPTEDYISSHYTTTTYFNSIYNSVETVENVKRDYLENYTTFDYEQFLKADAKTTCESTKTEYLNGSGEEILQTISPRI